MAEPDDHQLLAEFTRGNSEAAFAALVERHIGLVYSVALRSAGNAHAAEEITQAVFIILARKAEGLSAKIILSGWLYQTTRLTAANFLRTEIRRQHREQEAYMQSLLNEPNATETWTRIAPLLDDALDKLGPRDRDAIALRFFENKSFAEVGQATGASEDAAKVRVNRALEKLRKIFTKRGVTLSATLIASAVSANSVQAAPVGLAKTISVVAFTKGAAVGGSTLTLVKGALKIMAWTKAKMAIVVGVSVLLATGTATVVKNKFTKVESGFQGQPLLKMIQELAYENRNPPSDLGFKLRALGQPAITNLMAMLQSHDSAVETTKTNWGKATPEMHDLFMAEQILHHAATTALGEIGPDASEAIPALEAMAKNPDVMSASRAKAALMKIRKEPIEPVLVTLADVNSTNWLAALFIVKYLGTNAASAVPLLVREFQQADKTNSFHYRPLVAQALCGVASHPELSVPALISCLNDKDESLRRWAIDGLCKFPGERERVVPVLLAAMKDKNHNVWLGAALGLEENFISNLETRTAYTQALHDSLQSPTGIIRVNAAMFLQRVDFFAGSMAELNVWLTGGI